MSPDWNQFLIQQGATIERGEVLYFGDRATELEATATGATFCYLSQFGTLRVAGEDSEGFLQNLLTNDIHEVTRTQAQFSGLNTAKGRLLATMLIWRESDAYVLQVPRDLCENLRRTLTRYVIRSKVTIVDTSEELTSIGVSGVDVPTILGAGRDTSAGRLLVVIESIHGTGIKISETRWQLNTASRYAPELWSTLGAHAQAVGSRSWDWLNIRSGIPVILPQIQEQFVPQMVNLELIGGVSFKKGCYPGQEIVARTQYLGKLKRRMYLGHLEHLQLRNMGSPKPGDQLFSADMEGQPSGIVVNSAEAPGGGYDLLASIQISSRETQSIHWKSMDGPVMKFLPLPYSFPND